MLLAGKRLDGGQELQFRKALMGAFNHEGLRLMLSDNLDKDLDEIVIITVDSIKDSIFQRVIDAAERESWTAQLLQAALSKRPEDDQLMTFARQFGPTVIMPPLKELVSQYGGFEKAITPAPMYAYDRLLQALWMYGSQVCRIEANGRHLGTGFLIGSDKVMTCYHVWKACSPNEFICRFDHGPASEKPYHLALAKNYKVDISKHNPEEGLPNGRPSAPDELDYAILQLDGEPGDVLVRRPFQEKPSPRGWMTPSPEYTFPLDSPLLILQYPQLSSPDGSQKPPSVALMVSLENCAIVESDETRIRYETRVRYTTNTERGSSGAPCFNANWELVALHHFSDPREPPRYNQGIPFSAVKRRVGPGYENIFVPFSAGVSLGADNANGYETSGNTQPVSDSHSQNQASRTSTKQASSDAQEHAAPTPSSIRRKPAPRRRGKNTTPIDGRLLLKLLKKCPSGVFSEIVYNCHPPAGALSSDQAPQPTRSVELLRWAEGDGGIGLAAVHKYYLEAMEIEEKKTPRNFL